MIATLEKPRFWQPFNIPKQPVIKITNTYNANYQLSLRGFNRTVAGEILGNHQCPGMIVYTEFKETDSVHDLLGMSGFAVTSHIRRLQSVHDDLRESVEIDENLLPMNQPRSYHHAFVWRLDRFVMTDIWTSTLDANDYPTARIRVFRGLDEIDVANCGSAGGDTMIVMGKEEEYRRKVLRLGRTMLDFLPRTPNKMPDFESGFIARSRYQRR